MAALSKAVDENLARLTCEEIFHPNKSCFRALVHNLVYFTLGNLKLFLPIAFIPLFFRVRNLDKKTVKNFIRNYGILVASGTLLGNAVISSQCLFHSLFGRFYYLTCGALPALLGSTALWIFDDDVNRTTAIAVCQSVLEAELRKKRNFLTKLLSNSNIVRSIVFMFISAIILHVKRERLTHTFWFIAPTKKRINGEEGEHTNDRKIGKKICLHPKSCRENLMAGLKIAAAIGFSLDLVRSLGTKIDSSEHFLNKIGKILRNIKLESSAFFILYAGIYRYLHCYLNKLEGRDTEKNHIFAAFISGFSFIFYSKPALFSAGVVIAIEQLWNYVITSNKHNTSQRIQILRQVPVSRLLLSLAMAYLAHLRIYSPDLINSYVSRAIGGTTNNTANDALRRLQASLIG